MKYEMEKRDDKFARVEYKSLQDVLWAIIREGEPNEEFVVHEYKGKRMTGIYLMKLVEHTVLIEAW